MEYIDSVSLNPIDLGLERTRRVRDAMGLHPTFVVITVGGTNGKGSTCALLEAILVQAGYRVGLYTSPHLLRYNERVRIDRAEARDAVLCEAFEAVELARGGIPLTYFEFGTLAAMWLFARARVDVAILEVGLGGRLDAVNAFDPNCAVVTSIDMDHMDYLGDSREQIGYEKAGIFRPERPAVCGDPDPPETLPNHAARTGARLTRVGRDFGYLARSRNWCYWGPDGIGYAELPYPALLGAHQLLNASTALAALQTLKTVLPVSVDDIRAGLADMRLPARFQVVPDAPDVILDVAHNPQAARAMAESLAYLPCQGRTYAVFAMLKDKDIAGVIRAVKDRIDVWSVAGLSVGRGASAQDVLARLQAEDSAAEVTAHATPACAFAHARKLACAKDRIIVFGSFHTVSMVMSSLRLPAR